MARAGIYKSEVLRARNKLLALGRYPSIDAIREELGNTGSKGTIHRYLKEIEEEEGGAAGTKVAASEAIQDLVDRLAARLHEEADGRMLDAAAKAAEQVQQRDAAAALLKDENTLLRAQLERDQLALAAERTAHEQTTVSLRAQALEAAQLSQQVADLQDRLTAEVRHHMSLEEKHQHAREALDHFRQAAKEQRESEHRQYEQQTQYLQAEMRKVTEALAVKQHEVKTASQNNIELLSDLKAARANLHRQEDLVRSLTPLTEKLLAAERISEDLVRQISGHHGELQQREAANSLLRAQVSDLGERNLELERELAGAKSSLFAQKQIVEAILQRFNGANSPDTGSDSK